MKKSFSVICLCLLVFSPLSFANDLVSSAKDMLSSESASSIDIASMVSSVAESADISESQATGSLGAIFNYAKENLSSKKASALSDYIPQLSTLLAAAPEVASDNKAASSSEGVSGLLSKASEYSSSLSSMATLTSQFEALGLDADTITTVVKSLYSYLDSEQGDQVKALLQKGLSSLG